MAKHDRTTVAVFTFAFLATALCSLCVSTASAQQMGASVVGPAAPGGVMVADQERPQYIIQPPQSPVVGSEKPTYYIRPAGTSVPPSMVHPQATAMLPSAAIAAPTVAPASQMVGVESSSTGVTPAVASSTPTAKPNRQDAKSDKSGLFSFLRKSPKKSKAAPSKVVQASKVVPAGPALNAQSQPAAVVGVGAMPVSGKPAVAPVCASCSIGAPCATCGPSPISLGTVNLRAGDSWTRCGGCGTLGCDGGCGGGCGLGGCGCSACPKFFASAEYLLWWTNGINLPPLVNTSPTGTPVEQAGVAGFGGTTTVFGGPQESLLHSGGRYRIGLNLDCTGCNRIEFNYLFLTGEGEDFDGFGGSNGAIISRPFNNVFTGGPDTELVGFPGIVDGRMRANTLTEFQGFGATWRHNLNCCSPCGSRGGLGPCHSCANGCAPCGDSCFQSRGVELLLGYRHYELDDQVLLQENLTTTGDNNDLPAGTTFDIVDRFRTENKFDGVELGLAWEGGKSRWGLGMIGKVAFGRTQSNAFINGSTVISTPDGQTTTNTGGLLALDSNIGVFEDETFSAIPEFGAYLFYCLGQRSRFRFGYNMIYWGDVLRAGGIINTNVDPRLLPPVVTPNSGQPTFVSRRQDFWAQGLTFGFDFCF